MVELAREAGPFVVIEIERPDLVQRRPGELRAVQPNGEIRPIGKCTRALDGRRVGVFRERAFERHKPTGVVAMGVREQSGEGALDRVEGLEQDAIRMRAGELSGGRDAFAARVAFADAASTPSNSSMKRCNGS